MDVTDRILECAVKKWPECKKPRVMEIFWHPGYSNPNFVVFDDEHIMLEWVGPWNMGYGSRSNILAIRHPICCPGCLTMRSDFGICPLCGWGPKERSVPEEIPEHIIVLHERVEKLEQEIEILQTQVMELLNPDY